MFVLVEMKRQWSREVENFTTAPSVIKGPYDTVEDAEHAREAGCFSYPEAVKIIPLVAP